MKLMEKMRSRGIVTILTINPEIVRVGGRHLVNGTVFTVKAIDGNILYLKKVRGQ